ncbi:MAG: CRISPR-associated endonuclease/helicase Cas3 [Candidatus Atribacteria bacterium]|jgi:CRISPR-associated endonuclease/helicase Cas3|uniref:CRISPR-associated helicase Cas3' n=1 Tax=Atrimonas thermophila TaxID=3064161 RepID=UPI0024AB3092|nr:CRISPR-associated endonuclease/helicase Cas3 [Candidatus Atribacteria bacterium]
MQFYSHQGILLKEHLKEVGRRCREFFFFDAPGDLGNLAHIVGITHDFGKYTTYFQDRLLGRKDWGKFSDHALLSALYSALAVERLSGVFPGVEEIAEFLPLVAFFVVFHHHVDLRSLSHLEERLREGSEHREIIFKQVDNLKGNAEDINRDLRELGLPLLEEFAGELEDVMYKLRRAKYWLEKKTTEDKKERVALLTLSLFSALIDADKKSAGEVEVVERRVLPSYLVEAYKERKFGQSSGNINALREEIFNQVTGKVATLDLRRDRLLTLTAPTGSGKTLTGFAFALKLRERIEKELHYLPRIVYSLPFISIIDQNFGVLSEVLSQLDDFTENSSAYILGHHHLSDLRYVEEGEEKEFDEALALIESWESEVIVTTFVQLLHSVIGFKNRFLRKYHNVARSIIILDEVQNVPAEYWPLLRRVFKLMVKYLGCFIILSTATRPLIFQEREALELLEEKEKYFRSLRRVTLRPRVVEPQSVEDFTRWFAEEFYNSSKSYLLVLNTIRSSLAVYEKLKEMGISELYYLSANLVSADKLNRIREVKEALKEGRKPVLVSTQVVEAGVDLDFDCTVRDLGPLDSIIQVAGRCNRNFQRGAGGGEVMVVHLRDERGKDYAQYVYQKLLPGLSFQILKDLQEVKEEDFLSLADRYFKKVGEWKSFEEAEDIYRALLNLRFYEEGEKSVAHFQLIDEKGFIFPVFIEKDEKAQRVWERFREITGEGSLKPWERKKELLRIRRDFEAYIVNVRVNKKREAVLFEIMFSENLGYVPFERVEEFYNPETGFRVGDSGPQAIMI